MEKISESEEFVNQQHQFLQTFIDCLWVFIQYIEILLKGRAKMSGMDKNVKAQQEERLSKKHIQTLGYVQELMNENKKLRKVIEEYEQQKLHCDDLHAQNDAVSIVVSA